MSNWYLQNGKESDVVVSTRVRLARNIAGHNFENNADSKEKEEILRDVEGIIPNIGYNLQMLKLKDVKKTYIMGDTKVEALKGISLNFRNNELNVAFWLINTIGGKVELRFEIGEERNIISADYNFLSEPLDLKEIKRGASKYSFGHNVTKQAKSFIMDVTNNSNMTDELINENLNHLFKFKTDLNYIIVKRDNDLLGIYKRK